MSIITAHQHLLLAEGNLSHGRLFLRQVSSRLQTNINHGQSGTIFEVPRCSIELAACASYCNAQFSLYGKAKGIYLRILALIVEMIDLIMREYLDPERPPRSRLLFSCHSDAVLADLRIISPSAVAPLPPALRRPHGWLEYHVFHPSNHSTDWDTA
jgi:hypothetical protein